MAIDEFSSDVHLHLDPLHTKPLDIGTEDFVASIDLSGKLINFGKYHQKQGFAGFTVIKPFEQSDRYSEVEVRKFRKSVANSDGFGPKLEGDITNRECTLIAGSFPKIKITNQHGDYAQSISVATQYGIIQQWISNKQHLNWCGNASVQRAAYTQITEGGPLEDIIPNNIIEQTGDSLKITDDNLGCTYVCEQIFLNSTSDNHSKQEFEFYVLHAVSNSTHSAQTDIEQLTSLLNNEGFDALINRLAHLEDQKLQGTPNDTIYRRGITYAEQVSIPLSNHPDATCILTDHMLLPLSWNRDAYFVARVLLDKSSEGRDIVRKHINWMFDVADRGESNEWGRCYLANGKAKDLAYQLDQQFFPILELAEYTLTSGDTKTLNRFADQVDSIIDAVMKRKHENCFLFPTDETPGDDPLEYAYHFSSHILIWHTLKTYAKASGKTDYLTLAENVKKDSLSQFTTSWEGKPIFSYACDTLGNHLLYHDANDVPLALAPEWDFCDARNTTWLNTLDFSFSQANASGIFGRNQLGSVHTKAPWPLGDIQEAIIAKETNNQERFNVTVKRINQAAQFDGALPEAYSSDDNSVFSRHWFAWPNAFYCMLINPFGNH